MIKHWHAKKAKEYRKRFTEAAKGNAIARMYACEQITAEQAITALAEHVDELGDRLVACEGIRPRRFKKPDGTVIIWRCPEEHVPITELNGSPS